ncbi:hypothetical protein WJX81_007869 [Elliptochloris bilobata]|uniref:NEDD8-activating enzyme E1 regulatory subunit n=1 Tax=Elliptochloris bilobata TaxID=381761 RepID=A0AAW1RDL7_9CHLO
MARSTDSKENNKAALEGARICVLGSGPTATEVLKNLVLGGIASFTVVDDVRVGPRDLGNNFMLEASSVGQSRAAAATALLQELNDAVAGSFVDEAPDALLAANPRFLAEFSLVIATQMMEAQMMRLDVACRELGVPLLCVRAYGLVGYLRASLPEHCVVEAKPDNTIEDLRLHRPWPELTAFSRCFDLAAVDDVTHRHVPWAVLLIQALSAWHDAHMGRLPATAEEKTQFRTLLQSWQRSAAGVPMQEENFDEALAHVRKVFAPPTIPAEVAALMRDECATALTPGSDIFWVLVAALRGFVEGEGGGDLPLEGSIPDMTATTEAFLALQRLYRERAEADAAAVEARAAALLKRLGRDPGQLQRAAVRLFAKNARNLHVVRWRRLGEARGAAQGDVLRGALASEDTGANAGLLLLLRAVDRFHAAHGRFPGTYDGGLEEDVSLLRARLAPLLTEVGAPGSAVADDLVGEVVRFGACELHCVAAVMGAAAAQEAIKLLTRQFVPLGGTLVYNAMASTSSVFPL